MIVERVAFIVKMSFRWGATSLSSKTMWVKSAAYAEDIIKTAFLEGEEQFLLGIITAAQTLIQMEQICSCFYYIIPLGIW